MAAYRWVCDLSPAGWLPRDQDLLRTQRSYRVWDNFTYYNYIIIHYIIKLYVYNLLMKRLLLYYATFNNSPNHKTIQSKRIQANTTRELQPGNYLILHREVADFENVLQILPCLRTSPGRTYIHCRSLSLCSALRNLVH